MRRRFRFKRPSRRTVIIGAIALGSLLIASLTQVNHGCNWTGFGKCLTQEQDVKELRLEKTFWDWLDLLIVPAVLAIGAFSFNRAERQNELKIAAERAKTDHEIADDRLRDETLQAYLDRMSELLIGHSLRKSEPDAEVRSVARARTLTVLRRLDGRRRGAVLQFLYESKVIDESTPGSIQFLDQADLSKIVLEGANLEGANLEGANLEGASLYRTILAGVNLERAYLHGAYLHGAILIGASLEGVNLSAANLSAANLERAYLHGANLEGANLEGASLYRVNLSAGNLERVNLRGANLEGANLEGASLYRVNLERANLQGATVTPNQLAHAASINGATMPDGSIHD